MILFSNNLIRKVNYKSSYLSEPRHSIIFNEVEPSLSGASINFSSNKISLLASIGEFLERENMIYSKSRDKIFSSGLIRGYSIVEKK